MVDARIPNLPANLSLRYKSHTGATVIEISPPMVEEDVSGYDIRYSKENIGNDDGYWLNRRQFSCTSKNSLNNRRTCKNVLDDNQNTIWENNHEVK